MNCQTQMVFVAICTLIELLFSCADADVIMMNGQGGMPSIIENDDFDPDVILMPSMSGVIMNDDLVL